MPIATSCNCGRKLNLKDDLAGKMVKCPQCGTALKVPEGKSTATAVATPPPRPAPKDSQILPKPKPPAKEEPKAGPKILMGNFRSLDDFDAAGHAKKQKKTFSEEDRKVSEVGNSGGKMSEIAAEALKATETKPKHRCPTCGKGVKPEDVICTKCGTNIKTGRRLGESGFTLSPGKLIGGLVLLAICGLGAMYTLVWKEKPKTKLDTTMKELEIAAAELREVVATFNTTIEKDADPDPDKLRPFIAYLGNDALPVLTKYLQSGTPLQKRKAARLTEILAWNRYRSKESVEALKGLMRDSDPETRRMGIEALFWSSVDSAAWQVYWAPEVGDPQKKTDTAKMYALPFMDCRETLGKAGVKGILGPNGSIKGDHGRTPAKAQPLPEAALALRAWYEQESDTTLKLSVLIQAVRSRPNSLVRRLISYLETEPRKELAFAPSETDKLRALRCLRDLTSRNNQRHEEWVTWWNGQGMKKFPDDKVK